MFLKPKENTMAGMVAVGCACGVMLFFGCSRGEPATTTSAKPVTTSSTASGANDPSAVGEIHNEPAATADPYAPPTDAQIIDDVTGKGVGVLEVILSERPGKKSWSSVFDQYFWERGITIIQQAQNFGDQSDVKCKIGGFARYEITGGRYNYREFKTTWIEYDGIPRPSDEEVLALVDANLKKFLAGYAASMVHFDKLKIEMADPDQQKYVWHSPTILCVNLAVTYDIIETYTEVTSNRAIWEVRMFREDKDSPWDRLIGSRKQVTELSRVTLPEKEVRELEVLSDILARRAEEGQTR